MIIMALIAVEFTSESFSSKFANRKVLPTLHGISEGESVINVKDLSSMEPVVRCGIPT